MSDPIPLTAEDKAILDLECAEIAGHTCKVVLLGGDGIDVAALREQIGARIDATRELTRVLGGTSEKPVWVPAPDFDVADHVRPSRLGGAPDRATVLDEVATLFAERLDRRRPLWAIDVVPRSTGGSVLVWRIHHAVADGTTSMRFARELLWDETPDVRTTAPADRPDPHPDHDRRRAHLATFIEREFAPSARRSPFDGTIGHRRQIAIAEVPLGALHDAAKQLAGATLNDAVLAVVAGSMRRWVEARHGTLGVIRARVPVSLHSEDDDAGNRDSFFTVGLPLHETDPVARLKAVNRETAVRKREHDAESLQHALAQSGEQSRHLAGLLQRIESSPREFAVSVSNVPGPRQPVHVLGLPVEGLHSIAEIGLRHGLRVSVVSLADRLYFGFNADPDLIDGVGAMAFGVEAEAEALIGAAPGA